MITCTNNTTKMTAAFRRILLPLAIIWLSASAAHAQDAKPVTLDIKQGRMVDVLKELEKLTSYRFYYDTTDLDTAKVAVSVQQQPFTKVLDQLFTDKDLTYTIDKDRYVFITRGDPIHTELPVDFFTRKD